MAKNVISVTLLLLSSPSRLLPNMSSKLISIDMKVTSLCKTLANSLSEDVKLWVLRNSDIQHNRHGCMSRWTPSTTTKNWFIIDEKCTPMVAQNYAYVIRINSSNLSSSYTNSYKKILGFLTVILVIANKLMQRALWK